MKVKTRFAPSPTGSLHVGGARTALFNWLFARKLGGTFILRIEDTDVERSTEESAQGILESMTWLGLDWDEGPYFQSKRMDIYWEHLNKLKEKGLIYPAFETKDELESLRRKAMIEKRNPIYDRAALKLSPQEIQSRMDAGVEFVWRFKIPDVEYTDVPELLMAAGDYRVRNDSIGDFVITRPGTINQPGMPLYNFVCVIDDVLMEITHVIRGVEHLPNAAKQVLLYQAMGYAMPRFVHLPLIMKHGKKMSKRDKDAQGKYPVSVLERRDLGYLPEATLNHLALLGWSPADAEEIFTVEKLRKEFALERLSKANANFDEDKFLFLNSHYIKNMDDEKLVEWVTPYLLKTDYVVNKFPAETLQKLVRMEKKRCKLLSDFPDALAFFFERPRTYDEKGIKLFFAHPDINATKILDATVNSLQTLETFDLVSIDNQLKKIVEKLGVPFAKYGPVIRLALTGRTTSPSLGEMIDAFGKAETIERLQAAKEFILK